MGAEVHEHGRPDRLGQGHGEYPGGDPAELLVVLPAQPFPFGRSHRAGEAQALVGQKQNELFGSDVVDHELDFPQQAG